MSDPLLAPPTDLLILSGSECRELLDLDELRSALAAALQAHSDDRTDVPPRIGARIGSSILGVMPGNVDGMGLAAKVVSVFPANHGTDIPSHQGLIALFDQSNGTPLAVMDGAYITGIRTAAAASLAADVAARADASILAIIGAGVQGHAHAQTFAGIRDWTEIRVASRSSDSAGALADATPGAVVAADFAAAVRGADVVALCTDAHNPIIDRQWLAPGTHVSSVGTGREIDDATMRTATSILVEWRGAATNPPPAGSQELQDLDPSALIEVGEVIGGRAVARLSPDDITVYKSTGHAVEDIAAATLVHQRAIEQGMGVRVTI
jgi:alanine dehydrogenase